jgi:8-hydroxy-5-deazaflavin:NADPH oxidoreductase
MSTVTILGSGNMARGIATRVLAGGNAVQVLDRDPSRASGLTAELSGQVESGVIGDVIAGEVVVLAVPYGAAVSLVERYGDALVGAVIVDISNPVDFTTLDSLLTPAGSSAAEEVAKAVTAGASVVKAFNTTFAATLVTGSVAGEPLDVLIAGDDSDAKARVAELIEAGGLRAIDAGPLRRARQLEQAGFLHMLVQEPLGTGFSSALRFLG